MQQKWFRRMTCGAAVAGMVMLTGCEGGGDDGGGNASSDTPPAQVAGKWQGVFSYNVSALNKSGSKTVTLSIAQNGSELSGDIDGSAISGKVTGNSLSFNAPTYDLQGLDVEMSASGTYDGTDIVNVDGTAKAKKIGITFASGTVHSDRLTRVP